MQKIRPVIVCLCGSTRFGAAFDKANLEETLSGKIVLSIGTTSQSDEQLFGHLSAEAADQMKSMLAELHAHKIDLADEILVINSCGYIGESTREEIEYARKQNKKIRYLEPIGE